MSYTPPTTHPEPEPRDRDVVRDDAPVEAPSQAADSSGKRRSKAPASGARGKGTEGTKGGRGRGAKSGTLNRRSPGVSEDEINNLSTEAKDAVALRQPKKRRGLDARQQYKTVVTFASPDVFPTWKVKKATISSEVSRLQTNSTTSMYLPSV